MAANIQKKVNLIFETNTSQAVSNIQQLNTLLSQIGQNTKIGVDGGALQQAAQSARDLQMHLTAATNVNTGKLDLNALNKSLKSSGTDLQTLAMNLQGAGTMGEQAFLKLANAVSHAEVPMVRMNKTIQNFMTTLANTAKWQVASTMIHGVVGAFQNAVGHAKNLNKALTDIQIVTGYTSNTMANLARDASAAASALNTTTTEYAKAALIFYQQGLSGSAVSERADTVIKLAQVTGQSADLVSDQMTAIWNNFDDGSETLEYYADALTKLGASTAASTSEIATGLSKFAAVADTVGLSYETAAAAIATVVDKTRQSADVVGTAFKTVFARTQSLSLGETLEDGVDLTKYSAALEKVGVNVLTTDGRLRDMDDILEDLGEKWDGLGRETQVALAQTVGGVRQYNQVMALMNNWEDVEKNIEAAKNAQGELNAQHKTWSASYEASLNKLKKAKDDLYEKLINDEFLIKVNDILRLIIESVGNLIDRFGGLRGTIVMLAGMFSKQLFPIITSGFKKAGEAIYVWSGKAQKDVVKMQSDMKDQMQDMIDSGRLSDSTRQQIELSANLLDAKRKLAEGSKHMTEAQRQEAEAKIALLETMTAETSAILEQQKALEKRIETSKQDVIGDKRSARELGGNLVASEYASKTEGKAQLFAGTNATDEESQQEVVSTVQGIASEGSISSISAQRDMTTSGIAESEREILDLKQKIAELNALEVESSTEEYEAALREMDASREKIAQLEEKIKLERENLVIYNEALKLRKEMNNAQAVDETTSFGSVQGPKAGYLDDAGNYNSERLAADDAKTPEQQLEVQAENSQMAAIASTMGMEGFQDGGGLNLDASIASYEKLYEVIGQQTVMVSKLKGAETDLSIALDKVKKAQEAEKAVLEQKGKLTSEDEKILKKMNKQHELSEKSYSKLSAAGKKYVEALRAQDKLSKNSVQTLKSQKNQYLELAKNAGLSEKEIQELAAIFDTLDKEGTDNEATIKKIQSAFASLSTASTAVETDLRSMAGAMQEVLVEGGVDSSKLGALTDELEAMAAAAPEVDSALENTGEVYDSLDDKSSGFVEKLGAGIELTTQAAGQFWAMKTAVDGVVSAFAEGASPMEKTMAIMTALTTLMPLANTLLQIGTMLKKKDAAATGAKVAADAKETVSLGAKIAALWGQVTAQLASLMSNPFTLALGIAAVAAIAIMIVAINKHRKATEADTSAQGKLTEAQREGKQASIDQAKEQAKLVDSWIEQMHTMDELIAKYQKLNDVKGDTTEITKEILDSVDEQVEAYEKLAESMTWANPDDKTAYDTAINNLKNAQTADAVAEATATIDQLLARNQNHSLNTALQDTVDAMVSDIFTKSDATVISGNAGGQNLFIEDIDNDSIIKSNLANAGLLASWSGEEKDGVKEGWLGAQLRTDTKEHFIADYESLVKAYEDAVEQYGAAQVADDAGAQAIKRIIEASSDTYNTYKDIDSSSTKALITEAALSGITTTLEDGTSKTLNLRNISSYGEYEDLRAGIMSEVGDDASMAEIDDYLAESTANSLYSKVTKRINYLADEGLSRDAVVNMVKNFNDEQLTFFLEVDLNKYQTQAAIAQAIEIAKVQAAQEDIELNITAADNALKSLKDDGMTTEDWEAIRDSGVDFTGAGGFSAFMEMSYDEQKKYLEGFKNTQSQNWIKQTEEGIKAINTEIGKMPDGPEKTYLQNEVQALQDELTIRKEIAKTEKIQLEDLPVDEVNAYADALIDVKNLTEDAAEAATDMAIANFKLQRGLENLNGSFDEIADGLENNAKGTIAYTQALSQLRNIVGDISGLDSDTFTDSFLENNLNLIGRIAKGDSDALGLFRENMANSLLSGSGVDVSDLFGDIDYEDLESGDALSENIVNTLKNSGLTDSLIESVLSALGYSIVKDTEGAFSGAIFTDTGANLLDAYAKDRQIDVYEYDAKQTKEFDEYDKYNRQLSQIETNLNNISNAKNKAFGAQRLQLIRNETAALQQQITAQKNLQDEIEGNIDGQKTALSTKYGLSFDANDNMSNLDTITQNYVNAFNTAYSAYATARTNLDQEFNSTGMSEEEYDERLKVIEDAWAEAQETYEEFTEDIAEYDADIDLFRNSEQTLNSIYNSLATANLEAMTYTMEFNLEIDQKKLDWLDYKLNKIADNFYEQAEAAALLIGSGSDGKLNNIVNNKDLYQTTLTSLTSRGTDPEASNYLSDDKFKEGLDKVYSSIMNDLGALQDLDQSMMDYYNNTLAMASDELSKYTTKMEHHNSVLDHYKNLATIIGSEIDYKSLGVILEGQADLARNTADISKSTYEVYKAQAEDLKAKMDAASNTEAFELYQKNWEAAEEKAREAEDQMLTDLAAWAESEKVILENTLADLGKTLEETLTGGMTFDKINTQMERAQSLQEEYLTTTNKIYETTKMMRTAQQAIDASSNAVAKEKLKQFITQTKNLQDQSKLSKYELETQQAKYNLLVAEIALEEAQNAKSTVRLQRDSEGNFGYVYTANAAAVSAAQQKFDDAQNALYNKGLEGANSYTEKYQSTMSEMTNTLSQIQSDYLAGSYATEEEYQNAMIEAKQYYFDKLQSYSQLYGVAVSTDSNIVSEAWSTGFADMTTKTDTWSQAVNTYMANATTAFSDWASTVAKVKETTGEDLTTLSSKVGAIVTENNNLTDALSGEDGVIAQMEAELTAVNNLTSAYAAQRREVEATVLALETLAKNAMEMGITIIQGTIEGDGSASAGAATGGLTSSWGPQGKMLMVHENELILNADQTTRFFDNLSIMENILSTIDSYAIGQQFGGMLASPSYTNGLSGTLEQNVKIEASFPGVTDHNEIEEALNNLVNKASQYANR